MAAAGELPLAWEVAQQLLAHNHFATLSDTGEVLRYEGGVYTPGGEAYIKTKIQGNVSDLVKLTNHLCDEVLGHVRRSTYRKREEFDAKPSYLVLENCILNLEGFQILPHTSEYLSRVKLPVKFDPSAGCPEFKFIGQVLYPEDIPVAQEVMGYCLWKRYEAQKAALLVGDGSNGKSTFITVLKAILGVQNIASRSLQELESNRFAKADLYGKLANLYADLPDAALKSAGTFKMLTGEDPVTGEYKFRNPFTFVCYAKLVLSANKVPEVYEDTIAFFRRWIILVFPNRFEEGSQDRELSRKLTTPEELSGVLNWALDGLKRLRANGWRFSNSKSTEEVREEYIRKSSPIKAFLMDSIEEAPDGIVVKQDLFNSFAQYCRERKLPVVTQQTFFQNLPQHVTV